MEKKGRGQHDGDGILTVEIVSAKLSSKCDCFVRLTGSFSKQQYKTKTVKKNQNPTFLPQQYKFFTTTPEGQITLQIVRPSLLKDEIIGAVTVSTSHLTNGQPEEKDHTLTYEPKNKTGTKGSIKLKIHFPKTESSTPVSTNNNKSKIITDLYTIGAEIGRGGFSIVKEGVNKQTKDKVAIKIIEKKTTGNEEVALLHREIDIMRKLKHQHIIALYDVFEDNEKIYLVLELVTGGELFDQIVSRGVYSERDAAQVIVQILEAVGYMHSNGIAHRDLKPENLLCGGVDGRQIKVTDFGLSKDFGKGNLRTSCGTPDYVAPEVLKGQTYDNSVDIWSIGVICYILLCGFPPFYGNSDQQIFEKILKANYDFPSPDWDEITDDAKEFIQAILVLEPAERPTAADCLQAPWIVSQAPSKALKVNTGLSDYNSKRKQQINVV
jgi:tRNA A-37 threonylcarbamoyl transferase component Bud32